MFNACIDGDLAKMKELGYDLNSNAAKNFILFKYFSETLEVKGFQIKHFPFKYDFEDYKVSAPANTYFTPINFYL